MINQIRLAEKAARYEIELPPPLCKKLDHYAQMLAEWNRRMNLTAILEPEAVEDRHFIDSLLLAVQPEVGGALVDVGSGAGFPGVIVKLLRPEVQVTLMEPTGKRVRFLQALATELELDVTLVRERAEEAARKQWRERYDVAVARAVAAMPVLCEYCLPLVKQGGWFVAMKGDAQEEVAQAAAAMQKLGGRLHEIRAFTLPDGSARSLVLVQKVAPTPAPYPRNGGKIAKAPL